MDQTESINPASFDKAAVKRVALRCWSSNDMYNADFDYATVELTPALIEVITRRRTAFIAARAADDSLSDMRFFDYTPEYCAYRDFERWAEDQESESAWLDNLQAGAEVEDIPSAFSRDDQDGDFRSECDRMVVREDGVNWVCVPKHSSVDIETASLSWNDLGIRGNPMRRFAVTYNEIYTFTVQVEASTAEEAREIVACGQVDVGEPDSIETDMENWHIQEVKP